MQKADFGGGLRREAVAFSSDTKGYMGTGYDGDNDLKDFWSYDPSSDSWSELNGFGGDKRRGATSFTIGNKVYMGTGTSNGQNRTDFWEFNLEFETWSRLKDLDEEDDYYISRTSAVGLALNGYGYIVTGNSGGASGTIWEYNPSNDTWEEITRLEGTVREDAIGFSNGSRGFVLLGRSGSLYLDDIFELFPQEEYNDED